jgi:2-dehydro-3-deoxyglucarate aldolase/4-hydroxy-2-oxoheptanedioate aldolase
MIDMEHSALSLGDVQVALQAAGEKIIKIVRVPGLDEIWIKRILDTGCDGIIVPMIKSAVDAAKVVASSKYPAEGNRSVGVGRSHKYGPGFKDYIETADRKIEIIIQVEHIEGVRNIDQILAVKGISSVLIGPYDLSASMGLIGKPDHPNVRKTIETVTGKCRQKGIPWGIFGSSPAALKEEIKRGCTWLLCGVDLMILADSYKRLIDELRAATT